MLLLEVFVSCLSNPFPMGSILPSGPARTLKGSRRSPHHAGNALEQVEGGKDWNVRAGWPNCLFMFACNFFQPPQEEQGKEVKRDSAPSSSGESSR